MSDILQGIFLVFLGTTTVIVLHGRADTDETSPADPVAVSQSVSAVDKQAQSAVPGGTAAQNQPAEQDASNDGRIFAQFKRTNGIGAGDESAAPNAVAAGSDPGAANAQRGEEERITPEVTTVTTQSNGRHWTMQSRSRESEQENKLTDVCANPVEFLRQNRVSDMLELMRGSEPIRHSDDSFNGFYVTDEIDEEHWEGWLEFRTRSGKFEEREIKLEDTILSNNAVTFAFELSEESWSKGTPIIKTGKTKARNDGFFFKSQAYPNAFFIQPDVGVVLQLYWCESEGGFAGTIHGIYYMRSLALAGYPYVGEIHLSREAKK